MNSASAIHIGGLSKLEMLDLSKDAGDGVVRIETRAGDGSKFGLEPVTIAVVLITIEGLKILSAWLLKERKHDMIEKTVEVEFKDGSKRTETIKIDLSSSKAPEAKVLEALAKLTDVDLSQLGTQTG